MIRIALDFSRIVEGGSASYALGFLSGLVDHHPILDTQFIVLLPRNSLLLSNHLQGALTSTGCQVILVPNRRSASWAGFFFAELRLAKEIRRLKPDVVYLPREVSLVFSSVRQVILAHNLNVWRVGTGRKRTIRWILQHLLARMAVARASAVIAPSQTFGAVLPVSKRLKVIPHGCDLPIPAITGDWSSSASLRVVSLGVVSSHKRYDLVVERVAALAEKVPVHFDLIGPVVDRAVGSAIRTQALDQLGYNPLRGSVSPSHRLAIFRDADVLAVGSCDESFCMPITEALRTGTVVWAPDHALVRELCGEVAVVFDQDASAASAAAVLVSRLDDFQELVSDSLARSRRYEWRTSVTATVEVLRSVAK